MEAAKAFALEHCRITVPLEPYRPAERFAPTPEEYAAGDRLAYTENSWRTAARHEHSNYDELTRNLNRFDPVDQVYYDAIRERVEELIDEATLDSDESS